MTVARRLGVGIIGLGKVSPPHVQGYCDLTGEARVVAVCDVREPIARAVGAEIGAIACTDYRHLLALPDVDAVVVLLPHLLHHAVALAALEAGKHVTIEKPMAVTESQCSELIAVARQRGRLLSVSENSRFVESYLAARRIIETRALGAVRLVRGFISGSALLELADASEAWKHQRFGFDAVIDAAPHFFYLFRWLFGEVASLQAVSRPWARHNGLPHCEVDDGCLVAGTFCSGGHFSIEVALNVEVPWGERLEIYGDEGSFICDQLVNPPALLFRDANDLGTPVPSVAYAPRTWRSDSIRRGAADFVRAICNGEQPGVSGLDAAYAVHLAQVAHRSQQAGGALMELAPRAT